MFLKSEHFESVPEAYLAAPRRARSTRVRKQKYGNIAARYGRTIAGEMHSVFPDETIVILW